MRSPLEGPTGEAAGAPQLRAVVGGPPGAHIDVDEVGAEGEGHGLHGVGDGAAQQADPWQRGGNAQQQQ